MNLTLALLGKLSEELLTPLVFMIFSLSLTSSLSAMPSRLLKGAKSVFLWLLGIVTTVLVASISMQSFLAVSKDSAALRAAKYALTGTIPIVGSTVSGALSTLIGSLAEARAVIGVGAVAVIFSLAASPIIIMLLYRLALSVATWIFGFIDSGELSCFSVFRASLDALISLYAISAVVYILEIVIFLKGGVSAFV
jgi:stage III sporulation protein AE